MGLAAGLYSDPLGSLQRFQPLGQGGMREDRKGLEGKEKETGSRQ